VRRVGPATRSVALFAGPAPSGEIESGDTYLTTGRGATVSRNSVRG
jgi:hypothetical protein